MFKNKFVVYFKGVRGSYPTPEKDYMTYGGNTACLYIIVNNHHIILDAGSGIANAGLQMIENRIVTQDKTPLTVNIFLSHLHSDHIQGLPFFAPIHQPSTTINLFGPAKDSEELKDTLSTLLFKKAFPLDINEIKSNFNINSIYDKNNSQIVILKDNSKEPVIKNISDIKDGDIEENDVVIKTLYSNTHPKDGVLMYKIEYKGKSLVYATDKESYVGGDKILSNFARNTDLLIHDSQYTDFEYDSVTTSKQGFGHSTYKMAIQEKENAHAKALAFFHYNPAHNDMKLDEIKQSIINCSKNLIMPVENQEITIL